MEFGLGNCSSVSRSPRVESTILLLSSLEGWPGHVFEPSCQKQQGFNVDRSPFSRSHVSSWDPEAMCHESGLG